MRIRTDPGLRGRSTVCGSGVHPAATLGVERGDTLGIQHLHLHLTLGNEVAPLTTA